MRGADWAQEEWQRVGLRKRRRNKRIDAKEMEDLVTKLRVERPNKPYGWTVIQSHLVKALEEHFGFTLTSTAFQILKSYITTETRKQASEDLYEPKPPAYFQWEKMKKIWDNLWLPAPRGEMETRHKVVCVSYICYVTGARTKEACEVMIEDLEEKTEDNETFLRMPLRVSKSNAKKTRRESLILISRPTDIMPIMKRIKTAIGKRKAHGMRLGYILNSSIGGIEDDCIINSCRWKDGAMLRYYRNHFLEITKHGSAYKISKRNEEVRLGIAEEAKKTSDASTQTESQLPQKTKTQTVLRVVKKMNSIETQTEKITLEADSESDDEFEGGIYRNFLSMRTPLGKDREIGICGTINCAIKLVTAADGIHSSEEKWKQLNLQCSMLLQPMSMFLATRTLTKMKEGRKMVLKDAIDSASENLFYELMNLKAFHDNINSSSKMSWVLRDWNMVRDNIVTKLIRLDASVDRSLTEVDETIRKKIETAGLDGEPKSPATTLTDLEAQIGQTVKAHEARARFSVIYLVKKNDETPLVVLFKHDNYIILDTSEAEWTFNTRVDWEGQDKSISKILEGASKSIREYSAAQHAVIIAVSGEEFVTKEHKMVNRRYRRWLGKRRRPRENASENEGC
ncbi:unnamed protein product [Oikopleura dioica]|uniref:Uncharacterized protein n=1 Tax=Oikopleura dioica TaxID=34765 RepID=E4XCJ7_OIKDI|nr:unnamed protein product [Oikopleura dioica]